ncbi:hypothetical protein HPB48_008644 [Haemaphysalis longicornis]|uniref:Endoplasmic reticulum transmembrane protein n=1 Tax=Haemaphysalis longicornis TaxID=44386 RepID=A0A9J6H4X1_HAELO|nr:hypothetical protein HPB48_008644 [Haemaphysalis longicornis]
MGCLLIHSPCILKEMEGKGKGRTLCARCASTGAHREEAQSEYHHHGNLDVEMQQSMKMFRAQRNFYIAGFSLFLWLGESAKQNNEGNVKAEALEKEIKELKTQLEKARKDVDHLTSDRNALKVQAENLKQGVRQTLRRTCQGPTENKITMGIQWTLVATFLYAEIAVIILLLIPGISPKSFAARDAQEHTQRQEAKSESHDDGNVYMQLSIQMFRAQRNVYIAGFSLFLWLVIHRLVTLIRDQAILLAVNEAAVAQARPAAEAARSPLKGSETAKQKKTVRIQTKTVDKPKEEPEAAYEKACKDVDYMTSNLDALKMHAEDLYKKYDRLFDEHAQVEQTVAAGAETKKDD